MPHMLPKFPGRSRLLCWLLALLASLRYQSGFLPSPRAGWKPNGLAANADGNVALERLRAHSSQQKPSGKDGSAKVTAFLWRSEAGRLRALQMLGDRYGGQYDVSRMDEAWWKAHVKGRASKLDVTCRRCGHRSRSTSVSSLQQGTTPGCFCKGGVPWSSPAGRARCLEMIWERYAGQYDVRRMDEAWWKAHVKGKNAKLDVTCRRCGHRSRGTRLSDLQQGKSPGCFCNGGVPWSSPAGRARCLEIIWERYGGQYDVRRMDEAWWKAHVKGSDSKLDVTCRHCGHRSRSTRLNDLQTGHAPGCFCNGGVPWSSPAGRARCLEMIWERYAGQYDIRHMDESWWKAHVKGATSKLDVTCRHCGHRSRSTSLDNLRSGQSPGCFCNGGVLWSSPAGRARCLEMIWERYGGQYDVRRMDEAWWKAHVKGARSKLDVTCRHCGHRSRSTKLNNLKGRSPGCLCSRKTERKLMRWLAQNFSQFNVTSQVGGCTSPASNRTLPFDFGLNNDTILIELDGNIGHFGVGWGGSEDDKGVPQRDHFKEQWALRNGKTVVRLLQEDVYGDSWDWKGFLASAVQQAIRNSSPCVITQEAVQYKSGVYHELRGCLRCQVGYFQSGNCASIPYLTRAEAMG